MQQLKKLYRYNYEGENIVTEMTHEGNQWNYTTEYVPNAVINTQISNKALIIGNGTSRASVDLSIIKRHKGGLLAAGALQTYGCNALYRDFVPDFLVASGDEITKEIANSGYCNEHIVYASSATLVEYPNKFYLTPQDVQFNSGAVATYLAAFDGHKTVYLMGFDSEPGLDPEGNIYTGTNGYTHPHNNSAYYVKAMLEIFNLYNDVDFVRIVPTLAAYTPEQWNYVPNFRQVTFRDFVLEVDL